VVGTGTRYGTTAVEVAPILDATTALGGVPILALRTSSGDPRERHRGVSHHASTTMGLGHTSWLVADQPELDEVAEAAPHRRVAVDPVQVGERFAAHDLQVTTMGRTYEEDVGFFQSAGAAGALAAAVLAGEVPS
jgi:hypothetical protein